jgi:hypothetical protein
MTKALMVMVIAVLWVACAPQIYDGDTGSESGDATGDNTPEGSVTLHVPRLAPSLARALGASADGGLSTQALMIVNRVDFELYLDGALSDSLSVTLDAGPDESGETMVTWDVPAAAGYTLEARVYNTNVSGADPVLYGVSESFSVESGVTTGVLIRPTPDPAGTLTIAPTPIPAPPSSTQVTLDSCYDTGTVTDPGGEVIYEWFDEHWFLADASAEPTAMRIIADPGANSAVYMAVYDADGAMITGALSGAMAEGGPAYWLHGEPARVAFLSPGSTYFVGLITISDTLGASVVSSVDISRESFADDIHEENDTVGEAAPIAQAGVLSGIDLDQRAEGDYTGGDWFSFSREAADDENVTIVLEFDHDDSDLALGLYEWSGDPAAPVEVTTSDTSIPWDETTGQAGDLEEERIETTLAVGDYYIWVYSTESPVGTAYNLQWVAGNGTISIGLE